jgi:hypothetical protein
MCGSAHGRLQLGPAALRRCGAREGIADMVELGVVGVQVDGQDIEANVDRRAVGFRQEIEVGSRHLAEVVLLGAVDGGFGWGEGLLAGGGEGLNLEDDERGAVPGDEIEVSGQAAGTPATGDDGVAKAAEIEEGDIFTPLAGEQVLGFGADPGVWVAVGPLGCEAVGAGAESGMEALFERQEVEAQHGTTPAHKHSPGCRSSGPHLHSHRDILGRAHQAQPN